MTTTNSTPSPAPATTTPAVPTTLTFTFPNLTAEVAKELNDALLDAQKGHTVEVTLTYHKVTKSKARKPGEKYRPMLGVSPQTINGVVKKVATGENGPYILLDATRTRRPLDKDGKVIAEAIGWTAVKPEGIDAAQVESNVAPKPAPVTAPVTQAPAPPPVAQGPVPTPEPNDAV